MKAMIKLLHQGKAHSIGVSNYSIRELNELLDKLDVVVPAVKPSRISSLFNIHLCDEFYID